MTFKPRAEALSSGGEKKKLEVLLIKVNKMATERLKEEIQSSNQQKTLYLL